ncbi:hypothetical protein QTO34_010187 [Cnephaeus nilssonii]|uniref:Phostensin/Taperin N-terminal domain-containing protein n=1 Tax=Cnephaeus nilssonii TaxID=3371016 RepID=A0AA40HF23_CNENI|nr:hypothetical protein QTO34_010187 [Eptesicus nilssonii]
MPAGKREIPERRRAKLAALTRGSAPGTGADAARPVQQPPELHRRGPGVRTIQADNILILESVPGFPTAAPDRHRPGCPRPRRRGARCEAPPSPGHVIRRLPKFDPPSAPSREPGARSPPAAAAPAARPLLHKTSSSSFAVHPRGAPQRARGLGRRCQRHRGLLPWAGRVQAKDPAGPAPKPDMDTVPAGDLQARALARLRVNSRSSFVLVPKRKATGPLPPGRQPERLPEGGGGGCRAPGARSVEPRWRPGLTVPLSERSPRPAPAPVDRAVRGQRPSWPPHPSRLPPKRSLPRASGFRFGQEWRGACKAGLPVTFIGEVDSEAEVPRGAKLPGSGARVPPQYLPSERLHQGGHTFPVVPQRKAGVLPAGGEPGPEAEEVEVDRLPEPPAVLGTPPGRDGGDGRLPGPAEVLPHQGWLLEKEEKIFNDKSLHSRFEYPPGSSLVREAQAEAQGEEAEAQGEEVEEEEDGGGGGGVSLA